MEQLDRKPSWGGIVRMSVQGQSSENTRTDSPRQRPARSRRFHRFLDVAAHIDVPTAGRSRPQRGWPYPSAVRRPHGCGMAELAVAPGLTKRLGPDQWRSGVSGVADDQGTQGEEAGYAGAQHNGYACALDRTHACRSSAAVQIDSPDDGSSGRVVAARSRFRAHARPICENTGTVGGRTWRII